MILVDSDGTTHDGYVAVSAYDPQLTVRVLRGYATVCGRVLNTVTHAVDLPSCAQCRRIVATFFDVPFLVESNPTTERQLTEWLKQ